MFPIPFDIGIRRRGQSDAMMSLTVRGEQSYLTWTKPHEITSINLKYNVYNVCTTRRRRQQRWLDSFRNVTFPALGVALLCPYKHPKVNFWLKNSAMCAGWGASWHSSEWKLRQCLRHIVSWLLQWYLDSSVFVTVSLGRVVLEAATYSWSRPWFYHPDNASITSDNPFCVCHYLVSNWIQEGDSASLFCDFKK